MEKAKLTPREVEIYNLLLEGMSYLDIARRLIIEKTTVITHIMHIYQKSGLSSRIELMRDRIKELEEEVERLQHLNSITGS
jgi:DNA-binding NarL/FixJ family response regulator